MYACVALLSLFFFFYRLPLTFSLFLLFLQAKFLRLHLFAGGNRFEHLVQGLEKQLTEQERSSQARGGPGGEG